MIVSSLLLALLLAAQDTGGQPASPPPADAAATTPSANLPLQPDEVARVGGVSIPWGEFLRYVGTIYARHPEGDEALQRQIVRTVSGARAEALGIEIGDVALTRLQARILERAAAASPDGKAPPEVAEHLRRPELRQSLLDLALQQALVRRQDGLAADAPVPDERTQRFIDETYAQAEVEQQPLESAVAATFAGGEITREDLGRAVLELLPDEERNGALTELIGIVLVQRKAAGLGVALSAEAAATELAERQAYVARNPTTQGLTYDDVLDKVDHRTREELVASPAFIAQVLLRQLVELRWDDESVKGLFEAEREAFAERLGPEVDWEGARHAAWRTVRQRTYQQLFAECTIRRRF